MKVVPLRELRAHRGLQALNCFARTFTTFCSTCSTPRTSSSGVREISSACRSNRCGVTTTLTSPVSSSSVRKTNPLAVPGRWRQITSPAVATVSPSRPFSSRSRAVRTPFGASTSRTCDIGWPASEMPVMR